MIHRRFCNLLVALVSMVAFAGNAVAGFSGPPVLSEVTSAAGPISTPSASISGELSEYVDPQLGFSIKYPADWRIDVLGIVDPFTPIWEMRFVAPRQYYAATVLTITSASQKEPPVAATTQNRKVIDSDGLRYVLSFDATADAPRAGRHSGSEDLEQDRMLHKSIIESFRPNDGLVSLPVQTTALYLDAAVADSFTFPIGYDWTFEYGQHPDWWIGTSSCFGTAYSNLYHAAQDRGKPGGTPVLAVANGEVSWYDPNYNTYPGRVLIIRHTLSDGNTVYSMYGHLASVSVQQEESVSKGQQIGSILDQAGNSHLHWEMRYQESMTGLCNTNPAGPGYTYPNWPDSYGYTNPVDFVNSHQGSGNPDYTPPSSDYSFCAWEGARCSFNDTRDVAYGVNGTFKFKSGVSGGIECNNNEFGDPWSGVKKACFTKPVSSSCPVVSGKVNVYDLSGCGGDFVTANSPGEWNLASNFNDRAEAVALPSGWSVRLYKDDRTSSPSVCISSTATDLRSYSYSDGSTATGSASWMTVYNQSNCPGGSLPTTPSTPNPGNGATVSRTSDTTFSWNTNGSSCDIHIWGGPGYDRTSTNVSCSSFHFGSQWPGVYQWQITAKNSYGDSVGPTWRLNVRPYAPTSLNASVASQSQINLSWTKSSDDPGSVDGYKVYGNNGTLITTTSSGTTNYNVGGLSCSTSYGFYVTAVRQGIESEQSNSVSATTQTCTMCYALAFNHSGSGLDPVAGPTNSSGCPVNQYVAGAPIWLTASPASGWRVGSWNGTDNDSSTSTTNGLTMPANNHVVSVTYVLSSPTAPSQLEIASSTQNSITLRWRDNSDNETGFRIYRLDGVNVVWNLIGTVGNNATTFTDSGRPCGTGETYEVKAFNDAGESAGSGLIGGSTSPCSSCYILSRTHTGSGSAPLADPANSPGCPADQYSAGVAINLSASPTAGWHIGNWSGTSYDSSTATTNSLTMPANDHTVTITYVSDLANDDIGAPITISGLSLGLTQDSEFDV